MKQLKRAIGWAWVFSVLFGTVLAAACSPGRSAQIAEPMDTSQPSTYDAPTATPDATPAEGDLILLQAVRIDTSQQPTLDRAAIQSGLSMMGLGSEDEAYYLVQFTGAIHDEYKAAVERAGGIVSGSVPNHALVVKMDEHAAEVVAALVEVKWVGLYQPDYKVAPQLIAAPSDTPELLAVSIMTFDPAAAEKVAQAVEALGGQPLDWQAGARWGIVRAEIAPSMLRALACLVEVSWIEPYVAPTLDNDVSPGVGG
jgi:serine protease AprX